MLLPDKHIRLSESIIGLAAFVLEVTRTEPSSFDDIWRRFLQVRNTEAYPAFHDMDNVLLAISFLYSIGAIRTSEDGTIARCD